MTTPIDLDTVRTTFAAQRSTRRSRAAHRLAGVEGQEGVIELLWSQRQVQDYGAVSRIEVLSPAMSALPSCRALAVELERRWVQRRTLGGGLAPISVSVELVARSAGRDSWCSSPPARPRRATHPDGRGDGP